MSQKNPVSSTSDPLYVFDGCFEDILCRESNFLGLVLISGLIGFLVNFKETEKCVNII